jgi:hypothetical protein
VSTSAFTRTSLVSTPAFATDFTPTIVKYHLYKMIKNSKSNYG